MVYHSFLHRNLIIALLVMAKIKITKGNVDKLQPPAKGQKLYMDEVLKGFGILVGAKAKTYIAQRDITGRTVRVTLGRHGVITTAQARSEAMETIGLMHRGVNPNDRKRARQGRSITLGDAAELYLGDKKLRSENTIKWFRSCMRLHLSDWQNKPLAEITRQMVNARHRRIGETSGPYAAHSTKRAFDVAYNRAMKQYEDLPINPTINIVRFPEYPRKAAISAELLATCHKEIQAILHPILGRLRLGQIYANNS